MSEVEALRAEIAGYQASCDGWRDENSRLEDDLAASRAERDDWQDAAAGWEGNFHAVRADADRYRAVLERVLSELRGERAEFLDNTELAEIIAKALGPVGR